MYIPDYISSIGAGYIPVSAYDSGSGVKNIAVCRSDGGHCVLGIKGEPVHFSKIERYISNLYLDAMVPPPRIIDPCRRVAIIGTGPAGITIAVILAKRGYNITMFENHDKIGGVLQYGIPGFRLPRDVLDRLYTKLVNMGIKIRPNILVGTTITIDDLFQDAALNCWTPRRICGTLF